MDAEVDIDFGNTTLQSNLNEIDSFDENEQVLQNILGDKSEISFNILEHRVLQPADKPFETSQIEINT